MAGKTRTEQPGIQTGDTKTGTATYRQVRGTGAGTGHLDMRKALEGSFGSRAADPQTSAAAEGAHLTRDQRVCLAGGGTDY